MTLGGELSTVSLDTVTTQSHEDSRRVDTTTPRHHTRLLTQITTLGSMSPNTCYYEVGIQTKHVKLAVRIPDIRSSGIKLKKTMKKPKMMMRRWRRAERRSRVDTSSLASLDIDWAQEFEEKYAELLVRTQRRRLADHAARRERFQEELQNISLLPNTSLLADTPANLSLAETCEGEKHDKSRLEDQDQDTRSLLTSPKKQHSTRNLKYSYHVLKRKMSFRK